MLFSITSTSTSTADDDAAAVVGGAAVVATVGAAAVVVDTALSPLFIRNDCAVFPWVMIGSSRCCVMISIISGSSTLYNGPSCISTHKRGEVKVRVTLQID